MKIELHEPLDVLYRIQRGLSGYVSYLAACNMNESFSEYVLYEPALRILTARKYEVKCEYTCPGLEQNGRGDKKKIDFKAKQNGREFALEMKWVRSKRINISKDLEKLRSFRNHVPHSTGYLCLFGRKSHIQSFSRAFEGFEECLKPVYAEFGKTRYGCRIYELTAFKNVH
jgi:hypothetical protein